MDSNAVPPRDSPPLHHPVPQHISQVPNLRSPPPTQPQPQAQANSYGYPQQNPQQNPQQGGGFMQQPGFGGFLNDPTAQMGFSIGQNAARAGQQYMEQNFNRYVNTNALRPYFAVSNEYVARKMFLVVCPWRHRPWTRRTYGGFTLPPREDLNSPDMYIPLMAFVTYILLSTLLAGIRGAFHPELLGITATKGFVAVVFELLCLRLSGYLLGIHFDFAIAELVAFAGYKFFPTIVNMVFAEARRKLGGFGRSAVWVATFYLVMAHGVFTLRSLRVGAKLIRTSHVASRDREHSFSRNLFLFLYCFIFQGVMMGWLAGT